MINFRQIFRQLSSSQMTDPLLSRVVAFYRIIGLRTFPYTFTNVQSNLSLLWSILLTCLLLFSLLREALLQPISSEKDPSIKPLLTWFAVFSDYHFLYSSAALLLYYQIRGPSLIRHLNDFPRQPFEECKAGKRSFACFLFLSQGFSSICYAQVFARLLNQPQIIADLTLALAQYINFNYVLLTPFLLHYAHYTITVALNELAKNREPLPAVEIVAQVQRLSKWMKQLNRLLTFPLALWLLDNSIDNLVNFVFLNKGNRVYLMVYSITFLSYLFYVVHFQSTIQQLLLELSQKDVESKENLRKHSRNWKSEIQLKGIAIYSKNFTFNIMSFCSVDMQSYCTLLLFILGFSVLLLQTK